MTSQYDYFAADSDDAAVRVLELGDAPLRNGSGTDSGGRRRSDPPPGSFDSIDGFDIAPTVNLADLEEVLTGSEYDAIVGDPRAGKTLAAYEDRFLVLTLTDNLQRALADLPTGRVAAVAGDWSHAEEFGGVPTPGDLTRFLTDLADLARRARRHEQQLYCRVRL